MKLIESMDYTTAQITAGLVALGGLIKVARPVVFAARRWYIKVRTSFARHDNFNNLKHLQATQDRVECAEKDLDFVDRVLLFQGHNCGDIPSIEKPYYTSVILKAVSLHERERLGNYDNILVDPPYIRMLNHIIRYGYQHFITEKAEPSILKDYYMTEGVTESVILYLHTTRSNSVVYVSFATKREEGFSPSKVAEIRTRAAGIQSAIRKMI